MGLPGHRRTRSHKKRRASHFALKKLHLVECPKCTSPMRQHHACTVCGTYAGRKVLDLANPLKNEREKHTRKHE
jgi:large subunit ribosomal protein L32